MASMGNEGPKKWRIQFMDIHQPRQRRTIRVSGLTKRQAEDVFRHIENIISARLQRTKLEDADAAWLGRLTDKFHAKLVRVGLEEPRDVEEIEAEPEVEIMTLGKFLDDHHETGKTSKGDKAAELTLRKWLCPMRYLKEVFGADRPINSITHEDAHQFSRWLDARRIKKTKEQPKGQPMAENAKRKHMDNCKVFFNAAKRRGLIQFNPFEHQVSSTRPNRIRDFFVTREMANAAIEAAPDAQWRLLIALWRFAGLRKMEVMGLTWDDILWDQNKVRVHATKTARYEGREIRYVRLSPIRKYVEAVYEQALEGEPRVITRFSGSNSNLDKPLKAILHHAGLVPWPKLFQNMRASCETEWLSEGRNAHVVAHMMGHSVKVQLDHYAQVTDSDFDDEETPVLANNENRSLCASDDVGSDENSRELSERQVSGLPAKTRKTPENAGFSGVSGSGGGIRTPDTRIMIPLL